MRLVSYKFSELENTEGEWTLERFSLDQINLLVGQNASGKTRIINTVSVLSKIFVARPTKLWKSGTWTASFQSNMDTYDLQMSIEDQKVSYEKLEVNGELKVERRDDGTGKIWFSGINNFLDFKIPLDEFACSSKRDAVQHEFLEPLFSWAELVRQYPFSSDMGRTTLHLFELKEEQAADAASDNLPRPVDNPQNVVEQYVRAYEQFDEKFDKLILKDLKSIGYNCTSIDGTPAEQIPMVSGKMPIILSVQEKNLKGPTRQFEMSTGMFRALSILIHINYLLLCGHEATILIDDIGEGLDFERSTKLIDLIVKKCIKKPVQVIMTSNDRFVMNEVDLSYWRIVHRTGSKVKIIDSKSDKDKFDKFRYLGLSNFDFFSRRAYLDQ